MSIARICKHFTLSKKAWQLVFLIVSGWGFADIALIRREERLSLSTSVVVPCIPKHFQYIPGLLERYAGQTVAPDEVVISLSGTASMERGEIDSVKERRWPFRVKIVEHLERRSEGENRNLGTLEASGDLLLYQDADDVPYPQRVEIIKGLFEQYVVDHLIHGYLLDGAFSGTFPTYEIEALPIYYSDKLTNAVGNCHFHNGATALTREVAKRVKWIEGFVISTDTLSNMEIYKYVEHKVFLVAPLIVYREHTSSYHGINK